jgi:general nucleoside transport system permease protein
MSFLGSLWDVTTASTLYASTARLASLLGFAAVGEWVAEKAGTLNVSLEAMMLTGAFAAALGSSHSHNVIVALLAGVGAGLVVALVQANLSHRLAANQFVVGLTLNVLAVGLTAYLNAQLKPTVYRAGIVRVPLLVHIPLVGEALFGQSWVLYLLYALVPALWWLVYRTRWGLEVRSVGENPQAADVSGIHVNRRRRQAVCVAGLCGGLSGAFLTLGLVGKFGADGVSGRGFIAIAAVIFGGWTLRGTVAGACVFGLFDALRLALPALGHRVNPQVLFALPYVMALVTMLVFARRSRQPGALARPFVRGLT